MGLETATYISDLNSANPAAADLKSQGDDHLRLIKSTVKATFPNVAGAVLPTHTELNFVDGVTSAIQTQINTLSSDKAGLASPTFTGTPAAPTAAIATSTTQLATTAFVQTAIAAVNAQAGTTLAVITAATVAATAGQHIVLTNAGASTCTLPSSPTAGAFVWVTVGNARADNVVARNGQPIMSLAEDMTLNSQYASIQLRYINATIGWSLV
jgi:hypothetical protein